MILIRRPRPGRQYENADRCKTFYKRFKCASNKKLKIVMAEL